MIHLGDNPPEHDEDVEKGFAMWVKHGRSYINADGIAHYRVDIGNGLVLAVPNPENNYDMFKYTITRLYGHGSRVGIYAGSFDPFHKGHLGVLLKAAGFFDTIIVVVADNPDKKYVMPAKDRMELVSNCTLEHPSLKDKVSVTYTDKPVALYALESVANPDSTRLCSHVSLIRGIRNPQDFAYEQPMAEYNKKLFSTYAARFDKLPKLLPPLETVYFQSDLEDANLSSSAIRQMADMLTYDEFSIMFPSNGWFYGNNLSWGHIVYTRYHR